MLTILEEIERNPHMNLKIRNGEFQIEQFSKIENMPVTKEILVKLFLILGDFDKIRRPVQKDTREQYIQEEKICKEYERKWRKNKLLKLSEEEMEAYHCSYVGSTSMYNLYLSVVSDKPWIIQFIFSGRRHVSFNVYNFDTSTKEQLVEALRSEIVQALKAGDKNVGSI